MTPLPPELRSPPDAVDVLARTIWGEARGEDRAGREMVAAVIMNRVNADLGHDNKPDWWGEGVVEVCTRPFQFSCWNPDDANRRKLMAVTTAEPAFRDCLDIARRAVAGQIADTTGGATHYANIPLILKASGGRLPTWLVGRAPTHKHGNHTFFRIL